MPVADSIPYPWPYDGRDGLAPRRCALVVVGVQRRWAWLDGDESLGRIADFADTLRARGVQVVFLRHARLSSARRPGADLPLAGGPDAALVVEPCDGDLVIDATTHDGFLATTLDAELRARGRDHLLFVGLAAETVLDSTLRSANDRGYECLTLRDAAVPFDHVTGARALASITMSGGIFGAVGSTVAVVAALDDTAQEETTP